MKNIFIIAATTMIAFTACSSSDETVLNANFSEFSTIKLSASAETENLEYPINICAYTQSGTCVKNMQITEAGSTTEISLQKGDYTIIASSGSSNFTAGYTTQQPLMMASQNISLTQDLAATLNLSYKVAQFCVTLDNITDKAKKISVTIGSVYNQVSWNGELSGNASPTIDCTKNSDGKWTTGTFYVLPSTSSNVTMTINQTTDEGSKSYACALSEVVQAGKKYTYNGSYDNTYANYKLTLTLSANGWEEEIQKDFSFNDNGTTTTPSENVPSTPSTGTTLTAGTVWNGHIVALVNGNTATLLSTKEWNLSSASERPEDINTYTEGDYSDWRIPTEDEAKALINSYHNTDGTLNALNSVLNTNGLTQLSQGKTRAYIRYIYGDGTSAISFINNNTVSASDKTKDYRIRLVKTISINK